MLDILTLTIPFFTIIFLGSFFRKLGLFNEGAGRILARFAFFVVLPPFMFLSITSRPLTEAFNFGFIVRYETVTIIIFLLGILVSKKFLFLRKNEAAIFALNGVYPNYGYIGVPLCLLVFGTEAAVPIALILVVDTLVLLTLTNFFIQKDGKDNLYQIILNIFLSMLKNPLLLSVIAGLLFSAAGLNLPKIPNILFELLAGAAAPTALFALGITLVGQPVMSAKLELGLLVSFKLALHPILTVAIFYLGSVLFGGEIEILWIKVAILFSCLPIAANVFSLSEFYSAYIGRTATAIMLTTIIASLSVPITLFIISLIFT